jgi:hypothetical protein
MPRKLLTFTLRHITGMSVCVKDFICNLVSVQSLPFRTKVTDVHFLKREFYKLHFVRRQETCIQAPNPHTNMTTLRHFSEVDSFRSMVYTHDINKSRDNRYKELIFKHPVALRYIQCHCLRLGATQYILYYLSSLFLPHYMFRPYLAILRCR